MKKKIQSKGQIMIYKMKKVSYILNFYENMANI